MLITLATIGAEDISILLGLVMILFGTGFKVIKVIGSGIKLLSRFIM